jgi:hypothetical protein
VKADDNSHTRYHQHDDHIYKSCLGLCGASRQFRSKIGILLRDHTTLQLDLDELPHFIATSNARRCVNGRCLHTDHDIHPTKLKVAVVVHDIGKVAQSPIYIVTARAFARNLNIEFDMSNEIKTLALSSANQLACSFDIDIHSPPAGSVRSGFFRRIVLRNALEFALRVDTLGPEHTWTLNNEVSNHRHSTANVSAGERRVVLQL